MVIIIKCGVFATLFYNFDYFYGIAISMTTFLNLKNKYPLIDLGRCSECRGCIEIAPEVFRYNEQTGIMEVIDSSCYGEDLVGEAMKNCPKDCICWEWVR